MSRATTSKPHDAAGAPVGPDQPPPDVIDLPVWDGDVELPTGIEARLLDGNWSGTGPLVILWCPEHELHIPFSLRRQKREFRLALSHLMQAVQHAKSTMAMQ
jgi:hypothetical protein